MGLELNILEDRRKSHRLSLMMRLLSDECKHQTFASAYNEQLDNRNQMKMQTRAAQRGELTSIYPIQLALL